MEETYIEEVATFIQSNSPLTFLSSIDLAADLAKAGYLKKPGESKPLIAQWKTREAKNDYLWVECSNCGFWVENYKAVELGVSSTDVIGYKWHACPKCTAKMIMEKALK